jgi:hypothetical protein
MNEILQWTVPGGRPVRGCVFQASTDLSDIRQLGWVLGDVWNKVREVSPFKPLFCVSCVVYAGRECER